METIKELQLPADLIGGYGRAEYPYVQGHETLLVGNSLVYSATSFSPVVAVYPTLLATMKATVRDAEATGRWSIAREFAERVREDSRVREVWYDDAPDDAALTLIVGDVSLEDELHFEAVLTSVMDGQSQPFGGFLRIYSEEECPNHARAGKQLLP